MKPADRLTHAGFVLTAEDEWLWVEPAHLLTPELRTFIRAHKAEILQAIRQSRPQTLLQGDAAWQAHRWACTSCATAWQPQHRCPTGQGLWAALRPA